MRVELGEIEAVLTEHPAVAQAVALVTGTRLVAFVITTVASSSALAEELHAALTAKLPLAFLPSAIAAIDTIPVTSSGKRDLAALCALDVLRARGAVDGARQSAGCAR